MPIEVTSPVGTGGMSTTNTGRAPKQEMDGELFLSLLVTQLRYQDPSAPMDTSQMIAQTTQLAMMEQLTAMSTTSEEHFSLQMRTAAASLIGQEVSYTNADGEEVTGIATSVSYKYGVPQVTVDGVDVALDAISGVTARDASASGDTDTDTRSP